MSAPSTPGPAAVELAAATESTSARDEVADVQSVIVAAVQHEGDSTNSDAELEPEEVVKDPLRHQRPVSMNGDQPIIIPMPVIPQDVMLRILRMSIEGLSPASRYKILCLAAGLSQAWYASAQPLLCRDLVITSQGTATRWLSSPVSERYQVERLELDGRYGQLDAIAVEAVLMKARGVKRLRIDFVRGLSSRIFCLPNLSDLTHLTLHTKILCDATPIFLHFRLARMVLGGSYFPLALTRALFVASADTLVDLCITLQVAHSPALKQTFNECFGMLTKVKTLTDWCRTSQDLIDTLPYLPKNVTTLNTCFPDRHRINSLVRVFNLSSFPELTSLRFMNLTWDDISASPDGMKLFKDCQARGVEMTFGFEKDYLREELLLSQTEALKIYY